MAWMELTLTCHTCGAKTVIGPELGKRNPDCAHCGKKISNIEIFYLSGFVYVLSNPSIPGLFKIGCTERPVPERVKELSAATGVPEPYILEAYFSSEAPHADEQKVHKSLSNFRKSDKEFFQVYLQTALDAIYKVCERSPKYCKPGIHYETPDERATREAHELDLQNACKLTEYKTLRTLMKLNHLNNTEFLLYRTLC
jgi:hypothetical protein